MLILRIYLKFLNCLELSALFIADQIQTKGGCFGSLGTEPLKAIGGPGAKPPAAGGWKSGGKTYSRWSHEGLGAKPPTLENFAF